MNCTMCCNDFWFNFYGLQNLIYWLSFIVQNYVYWTVHHLDSWIKIDQLNVTCFFISLFNAQHVSDVNTSILRSLRLICWVISWVVLLWYVAWFGWGGVVWYPDAGWSTKWPSGVHVQVHLHTRQSLSASACIRIPHHTTPAEPQRNTKTHCTRAIQPMKLFNKQVASSWGWMY